MLRFYFELTRVAYHSPLPPFPSFSLDPPAYYGKCMKFLLSSGERQYFAFWLVPWRNENPFFVYIKACENWRASKEESKAQRQQINHDKIGKTYDFESFCRIFRLMLNLNKCRLIPFIELPGFYPHFLFISFSRFSLLCMEVCYWLKWLKELVAIDWWCEMLNEDIIASRY